MSSVIVFGPTGQIGSVVARTAGQQGAKVWLAMRDTSKNIPGLEDDSTPDKFAIVQADLFEPETVKRAVEYSGARRAFIYFAHGSPDNMRATIEALKSGGITFVVFVSSFTIYVDRPLRETPASEYIPYVHAQVEANLEDVFGGDQSYVPIRCGAFASNVLGMKDGIAAGQVSLYGGAFEQDNVNPADIGRVAGKILVSGPLNSQKIVYVYGPEIMSLQDTITEVGKVVGKDITITTQSRDEALQERLKQMPEHIATYLVDVLGTPGPDKGNGERFPRYDEGVQNIRLYTGQDSTPFRKWVEENRAAFITS